MSANAQKQRNVRVSLHPRSCEIYSYSMDDIGMCSCCRPIFNRLPCSLPYIYPLTLGDSFPHKPESGLAINVCLGRDFSEANLIVEDESGTRLSLPQIPGTSHNALLFQA